MDSTPHWEIKLKKIEPLKAVYSHAFGDSPEQDAWVILEDWARSRGLLSKENGGRIFGRNTYPTDNPEPQGYQLFLTIEHPINIKGDIRTGEIPGGLYAVLEFTRLDKIGEAWKYLWNWVENKEYKYKGWEKGEYGWVNGFEEHLNPFAGKPPDDWFFNLWIPLKE